MGTLFLSGGGDRKNTEKFDVEFRRQIGQTKPLLFIPIAFNGCGSSSICWALTKSSRGLISLIGKVKWVPTLSNVKHNSIVAAIFH